MKCKCKANPKPEVTWFRGSSVVKESSKISIRTKTVEEDVYELIMEIKVTCVCVCVCVYGVHTIIDYGIYVAGSFGA